LSQDKEKTALNHKVNAPVILRIRFDFGQEMVNEIVEALRLLGIGEMAACRNHF